jgi:hypothetical protein
MITTIVTTSTVAIVNMYALGGTLALISLIAFATMLVSKDVTSVPINRISKRVNQAINIAFIPLLVLFIVIVAVKIIQILW